MQNRFLFSLLIAIITFLACTESNPQQDKVTFTDKQLGQMLVIGFRGTEVNSDSSIVQDIKQRNLGGVILYDYDYIKNKFGRNVANPDQLLQLNSSLVAYSSTPPIIAVENDGSKNSPLYNMYPELNNIFSNTEFSDTTKVRQYARNFAQEFMVVGLNTNLHPRLDLSTNTISKANLISSDPKKVTNVSNIILDEYDTEKLLSVPKYFPGYSTNYESTDSSDIVTETWSKDFLIPYKSLFQTRTIRAIQTSHSLNVQIDSVWPGTFSASTISGLLRDSLDFQGVVFSDDLQKPIISSNYDLKTSILQSINAGVDILVFGNNFEYDKNIATKAIAVIQELLAEEKIAPETIQASLARIDKLKQDVIAELCTCLN
jgi:beta-N-acetylhexosaminidase